MRVPRTLKILGLLLVGSMLGGTAFAATVISSKDIKDESIQNRDIDKGVITMNRFAQSTQDKINKAATPGPGGGNGSQGPAGPPGVGGAHRSAGTARTAGSPGTARHRPECRIRPRHRLRGQGQRTVRLVAPGGSARLTGRGHHERPVPLFLRERGRLPGLHRGGRDLPSPPLRYLGLLPEDHDPEGGHGRRSQDRLRVRGRGLLAGRPRTGLRGRQDRDGLRL